MGVSCSSSSSAVLHSRAGGAAKSGNCRGSTIFVHPAAPARPRGSTRLDQHLRRRASPANLPTASPRPDAGDGALADEGQRSRSTAGVPLLSACRLGPKADDEPRSEPCCLGGMDSELLVIATPASVRPGACRGSSCRRRDSQASSAGHLRPSGARGRCEPVRVVEREPADIERSQVSLMLRVSE
jgi:hypothetical protein